MIAKLRFAGQPVHKWNLRTQKNNPFLPQNCFLFWGRPGGGQNLTPSQPPPFKKREWGRSSIRGSAGSQMEFGNQKKNRPRIDTDETRILAVLDSHPCFIRGHPWLKKIHIVTKLCLVTTRETPFRGSAGS